MRIFLSYSRTDGREAADRLQAELETANFEVCRDLAERGGQSWRRQIRETLRDVDVVLVLLTPRAVESQNVDWESETALTLEKRVISLLLHDFKVPPEFDRHPRHNLSTPEIYAQGFAALIGDLLEDATHKKLFLSYSRTDAKAATDRLRNELRTADFTVWRDLEDMRGGKEWKQQVETTLRKVDAVVVLLTPRAVESQNVQFEWMTAQCFGKSVFPVLILPCDVPSQLQGIHYHNLSTPDSYTRGFAALIRDLISLDQEPRPISAKLKTGLVALLLSLIGLSLLAFLRLEQRDRRPTSEQAIQAEIDVIRELPQPERFADVENIPSGEFNYGGSTTWATIRGQIDPILENEFPAFNLNYTDSPDGSDPGSGTGIELLLSGENIAFTQSSRRLKPEEERQAEVQGFTLEQIPVAKDGIAIAVHPNLNIEGLTLQQLKAIYTGQVTNWRDVGGPNRTITPYSRTREAGGTVDDFINLVLDGQDFGDEVVFVDRTTNALQAVANNPGGIYYASAPEVVDQCTVKPLPIGETSEAFIPPYAGEVVPVNQCPNERTQLNITEDYPLTRPIYVIVKGDNQAAQRAGKAYANLLLTDQGQDLLDEIGFVPIR